jgi:hypothetical protein
VNIHEEVLMEEVVLYTLEEAALYMLVVAYIVFEEVNYIDIHILE